MSKCRKGTPNIPKCDLNHIVELAKTLSLKEIGDKWEVSKKGVLKFLGRHGYKASDIKYKHRIGFVTANPDMTINQVAAGAGCSRHSIINAKRRARRETLIININSCEGIQ